MKEKKNKPGIIAVGVFCAFCVCLVLCDIVSTSKLHKCGKETKGVIIGYYSKKYEVGIKYTFVVNGKHFEGKNAAKDDFPQSQIGDSVWVLYEEDNPSNNEALPYSPQRLRKIIDANSIRH